MKSMLLLSVAICGVGLSLGAVVQERATTTTAVIFNPTTCTTKSATPEPTGLHCYATGNITSPSPLGTPLLIESQASILDACVDACIETAGCGSFSLKFVPDAFIGHFNCQLYNKTLKAQGYKNQHQKKLTYWDLNCFVVNCAAHTTMPPTKTTCTPAITQYVKDPSFESPGTGGWKFSNGAQIVRNDPKNAYSGNNYAQLSLNSTSPEAFQQIVQGLNASAVYLLRFLYKITVDRVKDEGVCNFQGGPTSVSIYEPLSSFPPGYQLSMYTSSYSNGNASVNFNLGGCSSPSGADGSDATGGNQVTVDVDSVTLTNLATNCPFVLQIRSLDNRVNGQYLIVRQPVAIDDETNSLIGRTYNQTAAPTWSIDTFGDVYLQDPYEVPDNRFLYFYTDETRYHTAPNVDYAYEDSVVYSNFGNCSIDSNQLLHCSNFAETVWTFCSAEDTLYLDNPSLYPTGFTPCSTVQLQVVYV